MKKLLTLVLLSLVVSIFAETIILTDNREFEGEIIGKQEEEVYLDVGNGEIIIFSFFDIKEIKKGFGEITNKIGKKKDFLKIDLETKKVTRIKLGGKRNFLAENLSLPQKKKLPWTINKTHFSLTLISSVLAWDYFVQVSDINDWIDSIKKQNKMLKISADTGLDSIEKSKNRKMICGISFTASALINLFYSVKKVEIQATPEKIELSYKF